MTDTDDSDSMLEAFSRKTTATRNLHSLEGKGKKEGKSAPSDNEDEDDRPPFEPGLF